MMPLIHHRRGSHPAAIAFALDAAFACAALFALNATIPGVGFAQTPNPPAESSSLDRAVDELKIDNAQEKHDHDAADVDEHHAAMPGHGSAHGHEQSHEQDHEQGHDADHSAADAHAKDSAAKDSAGAAKVQYADDEAEAEAEASGDAVHAFFATWHLFHNGYFLGWLVALLLSIIGVVVVARDQVFIGAAISQASALGIAVALCLSTGLALHHEDGAAAHDALWICCDSFQVTLAVAFSVLAALITASADRAKRESHEAITGWVFLISTSLSVLVVAHSPHGMGEINRIHASSIIGATPKDIQVFAALLVVTVLFLAFAGRRLLLFIMDRSMAASVGMNVSLWASLLAIWLGLVVGLSIRASGVLFTFGSLVLPALVAKNVCREVRPMFFVAPIVAFVTSVVGFVLANRYDFPPAQMTVALWCILLLIVWALRSIRRA
jgi:zinc transport system permease protein